MTPPKPPSDDDGLVVRGASDDPVEAPTPVSRRATRVVWELTLTIAAAALLWLGLGWFRAPELPEAAPGFDLAVLDGGRLTLAELRGKTVVLNFWATWCGPCRMEVPGLTAFAESNPDIPVLGIAVDGTPEALRAAAKELGIGYPVLLSDAATRAAYGVNTLPTTIIVSPEGTVKSAHAGLMLRPHLWWLTL